MYPCARKERSLPTQWIYHPLMGASSTEGGLVIDLSRYFKHARVDPERKIGYVGGGPIWENVDKATIEHGRGMVNHIGAAGQRLSLCYGLTLGNVLEATVVLADGLVVKASKSKNNDLLWAFALKALTEVTSSVGWWDDPGNKSPQIQTAVVGPNGKPVMLVIFFYNGPRKLFDIGPIDDQVREIPYEVANALQVPTRSHITVMVSISKVLRIASPNTVLKALDRVAELIARPGPNPMVPFECFPLHQITAKHSEETPFRHVAAPFMLVNALWVEDTPENLKRGREMVYELIGLIKRSNPQLSVEQQAGYANQDDETVSKDAADKARLVFGKHYAHLQEVKKKYDPDQVYHQWVPIIPAP
ncbi:uncharacterized protein B0H18DRAFT_1116429 [Fomitopsis serialis]|uniref:uncharacterized protein n=1 Tax=Fomitopsis serialis TaxID=139415 RepID=UPI002008165E|nr:uncharacterized protein B0H18DRAFT_1116429 [Neoantrodia serialis]KAH9931266.1 hypothetical protein B0H18DRAFT_1116429 [Neoantrodia serialis]